MRALAGLFQCFDQEEDFGGHHIVQVRGVGEGFRDGAGRSSGGHFGARFQAPQPFARSGIAGGLPITTIVIDQKRSR